MTDVQAVLLRLLSEVDQVCRSADLKYFLIDECALGSFRSGHFPSSTTTLKIAMLLPDALELRCRLLNEKKQNRVFDSLFDNDEFPFFSFRYSDTDTTDIDLCASAGFVSYGIYLEIVVLRQEAKGFLCALETFFEKGWVYNHPNYPYKMPRRDIRSFVRFFARVLLGISKDCYQRFLLRLFEKTQERASLDKPLQLVSFTGKVTKFEAGIFSCSQSFSLEGLVVCIPCNHEAFFSCQFGERWREKRLGAKSLEVSRILDVGLPFQRYLDYIEQQGVSLPSFNVCNDERRATSRARKYNKKINKAWRLVQRTGARYTMWELYHAKKADILELARKEDWDALADLLAPYDAVVVSYLGYSLGVAFDEDILDAYIALLKHQGRNDVADRLLEAIPEQHRGTMVVGDFYPKFSAFQ